MDFEDFDELYEAFDADGADENGDAAFDGAIPADHMEEDDDDNQVYDFDDDLVTGPARPLGPNGSPSSSAAPSRRRGSRGSRSSQHGQSGPSSRKWRSGHIPAPPTFAGNVEDEPYCLRHYRRALRRWTTITREFLPANEQALRALDALTGEAALELEEVDDERYNTDTGIQQLLDDLEISFGERELFRRGGLIREYESLTRVQGESVCAFLRRFRLYERKLKDAQVPPYPDETRAVKLLDGLRLDERVTSQLLLAAGNRYSFQALVEAIHIQYPAGLTLTGMSRHPVPVHVASAPRHRGRGHQPRGRGRGGSFRWKTWHTEAMLADDDPVEEVFMTAGDEVQQYEDDPNDDTFDYQFADYDEQAEDAAAVEEFEPDELPEYEAGDDAGDEHQAMTATSKRLAATMQSRGYYTTAKDKGKGKGHGKGAGKDKGFGKKGTTSSSSPTTTSKGKGSGKSKAGSKGGKSKMNPTQRQRMQASLCLGCGASDHWLRECPHVTQHQAHVCSASSTLDGDGTVVWMTSHNKMPGWQPESPPSSSAPSTLSRRDEEEPPPPPPRRELPAEDALPPWDVLVPEGMNPDDHADYEDDMAFWRQEAASLHTLMDENGNIPGMRELPTSPASSFRTAPGTIETDFASCAPSRAPSEFQDAMSEAQGSDVFEVFGVFGSPPLSSIAASSHDFPRHVHGGEDPRTSRIQQWGEDPRTSRVEQQWGEDPRTSREEQQRGEDPRTSRDIGCPSLTLEGYPFLAAQPAPVALPPPSPWTRAMAFDGLAADDESGRPARPLNEHPMVRMRHASGAASTSALAGGYRTETYYRVQMVYASRTTRPPSLLRSVPEEDADGKPRDHLFRAPPITNMMQYTDEPCLAIVDTGCQRQVAGRRWHELHLNHVQLPRLFFVENCAFRFGPSKSSRSRERYAYPAGLGGHFCVMFFSCVEEDAPALMSRHTMTTLDAIPDISTGKMIYRALGTTSQLYLSTCGHLAVRLDEWPEELPSWPCQMPLDKNELPDVWAPTATPVQARPLPSARHPAVTPPGDARSSFMAEALASAAGPPVEPGGDCEQVGAPLRCFELEATSARRHHQALHGSLHGGDHADLDGSNGSSGQHADPDLPEQSIGVRAPLRPSSLRGGRPERSHLRPVRFQGSDPQGSDDPSAAQSKSSCSNPSTIAGAHLTTQQKQSRRQSIKQSRRQERSPGKVNWFLRTATFWLGTFLAFLSGLLLGTTSVSELGQHDAFAELDSSADPATASRGPGATSTPRDWSTSGGASSATLGADGQGEGDSSYAFDFDGTSAGDSFGQRFSGELGSGWLAMEPGLEQPFELGPALRLDGGDRGAARGLRERPGELPGHGPGTDVPGRFGSLNPQLSGSADRPLTFEDRGFQLLKPGRRKRLPLGSDAPPRTALATRDNIGSCSCRLYVKLSFTPHASTASRVCGIWSTAGWRTHVAGPPWILALRTGNYPPGDHKGSRKI